MPGKQKEAADTRKLKEDQDFERRRQEALAFDRNIREGRDDDFEKRRQDALEFDKNIRVKRGPKSGVPPILSQEQIADIDQNLDALGRMPELLDRLRKAGIDTEQLENQRTGLMDQLQRLKENLT